MSKTIAVIGSEGFVGSAFCRMVEGFYGVERCDPALGLLGTLTVGCFDYNFILPHRIAKANKQNDIKQDVKDIIANQKLILEKLK